MKIRVTIPAFLTALLLAPGVRTEDAASENGPGGADRPVRIAVVVNKSNPTNSLGMAEVRRIFLRKKQKWPDGSAIAVFERATENPVREQFSQLVLGKTPSQLRGYWLNMKLTRGLRAPRVCRSPSLLRHYLQRIKGGIGYMYEDKLDDTVKVVKLLEIREDE
ncbi:MAG: hypothetical protein ACE5G2_05905 [Candidatus Krumholzibacteriia bacterium]